jgi:hypothetical protein
MKKIKQFKMNSVEKWWITFSQCLQLKIKTLPAFVVQTESHFKQKSAKTTSITKPSVLSFKNNFAENQNFKNGATQLNVCKQIKLYISTFRSFERSRVTKLFWKVRLHTSTTSNDLLSEDDEFIKWKCNLI